jgi:hypothetical protein
MRVLDGVNTRSLIRPGHESSATSTRSAQFIRRWGCSGNLSLGQIIGDEELLMVSRFWVGCGWFFWSGRGGEEKATGHVQQGRFSLDDARF